MIKFVDDSVILHIRIVRYLLKLFLDVLREESVKSSEPKMNKQESCHGLKVTLILNIGWHDMKILKRRRFV